MSLRILKERYEIVRQLAKKAGRKTLLARDLYTNELVVVKLLTFNSEVKWEELKLFEREAKTLRNLSFSAIPGCLDFFEVKLGDKKALAFVQTYIEADSLEQHIEKRGIFQESEVKELAKSFLRILVYLQEQNPPIIHRDIKPSNILLTNRSGNRIGDIFLVDFGSVQALASSNNGILTVVGTYGYMAPEQFGGRAVAASDLYGLGATLIYLLTGKSPQDLPQKQGLIEFKKVAECSREFSEWLKRMIEPLQEKRFKTAAEALENLEGLSSITLSSFSEAFAKKVLIKKSVGLIEILTPCQENKESSIAHFIGATNLGILYGIFSIPFFYNLESIFQSIFINYGLIHPYCFAVVSILVLVLYIYIKIWLNIIVNISFIPFGRKKLKIDNKRIQFTYKLLGLEYRYRASIPRNAIIKLDSNQKRVPEVVIWLGIYKYTFGKGFLNHNQAAWLSRELNYWLDIKNI